MHQPSSYLNYLPAIFHSDEFLGRFLRIFETVWEPMEQRQDHIALYFDPATCPANFLSWLASWFNLPFSETWPEPQRRLLVKQGFRLSRRSGTLEGLETILELCVGQKPVIEQEPDNPFVYRISVSLHSRPEATEAFLHQIIQIHKPAFIGYTLEVK